MDRLPIDPLLPDIRAALEARNCAVLQAPPGAGKTTRVPLALLDAPWLEGRRIIVLEPRRLAARAAARRMADSLGENVGETVGYRVRFDSRVGKATRIEVVTDGLFLRRLQTDPMLDGVGAVLFDEFHERSLDGDLSLALCREAQTALREDLRLLVMSATLDAEPVAAVLDNAPVLTSEGRSYPVETRYLPQPVQGRTEDAVARQIRHALDEETGSILVFLPGQGEIRRVQEQLSDLDPRKVLVAPLYGELPQDAQDRAIAPPPAGIRKVVLSTAIAETSLTIEGIRVVIDCGQMRVPRFDPRTGMTRLETLPVAQASADQRRGRAGRLEPGMCYRLWTEPQHRLLPRFTAPEIREADLSPLRLELACWGVSDPAGLAWLDPPPTPALTVAEDLLKGLGALDAQGRVSEHGRRMSDLGLHPRIAHMVLKAQEMGLGEQAAEVAAIIGERDLVRAEAGRRDADLRLRLDLIREGRGAGLPVGMSVDRGAIAHARKVADQVRRMMAKAAPSPSSQKMADERVGLLVALAYPDRIAQRRTDALGQFRLSNGRGAMLPATDSLAKADFLAVAAVEGSGRDARIHLAAPVTLIELESAFTDQVQSADTVTWDAREQAVLSRRQRRLGALVLKDDPLPRPDRDAVVAALIDGVRQSGVGLLPWTPEAEAWRARVAFLHRVEPETGWPDVSDEALLNALEDWLQPFAGGMTRRDHLTKLDLVEALSSLLDWPQRQRLDIEAPTHLTVPTGSRIKLDYSSDAPVLAVRLQEMFGLAETPRVAGGRVPVLIHLLSPGYKPVQVTKDLSSFWANTYAQVRADLRGRYPRHYWPDNPLEAEPTSRAKRRGT